LALAALISLVVALLSPLDSLSEALFAAHMLQHMLLLLVAPAFLLADPLPLVLWGLPHRIRLRVDHLFAAGEVLQLVYLVLAAFQKAGLALLLMLSPRLLYPSYAGVPRVMEPSALEDQVWGGIIMWAMGGAIDMLAVLVRLCTFCALEERHQEHSTSIKAEKPAE
jgi:cytochrome c oxidase assembly factor CtaG